MVRPLAPYASKPEETRGRLHPEPEHSIRSPFQRDRDRIIHSTAFRRLIHKTQVFIYHEGDHYRTRLTHVLEVTKIARTIAKSLRLNEVLAEAIGLGHDLGHSAFGHAGEAALNKLVKGGFDHYRQSVRVVEVLENDGRGLNLTVEVRDGILKHSKGEKGELLRRRPKSRALTLEGDIVRISDIIAYVNHDIDDGIRAGVLTENDLPRDLRGELTLDGLLISGGDLVLRGAFKSVRLTGCTTDPGTLSQLAQALSAVAARMRPQETARPIADAA